MIPELLIGDLSAFAIREIQRAITSMEVSFTMDMASELKFTVWDPKLALMEANYFQVRRDIGYEGSLFEISAVEVGRGDGASPEITVQARLKAVQLMKRDKNPSGYSGASGTDYARSVAAAYGLQFLGEPTAKKRAQAAASSQKADESTWDVLSRSGSDAQFQAFVSDGTLYFASQQWLLGKWNRFQRPNGESSFIATRWPSEPEDPFQLLEVPRCRTSDDDPLGAQVSFAFARQNATLLRPGMTILLGGMAQFNTAYLITEVSYEDGTANSPVAVSARTPEKLKPERR